MVLQILHCQQRRFVCELVEWITVDEECINTDDMMSSAGTGRRLPTAVAGDNFDADREKDTSFLIACAWRVEPTHMQALGRSKQSARVQ